ncbi:heterokaryon incompatibility protein-domain-containing protein [Xylaria digitata]|nr:heterokaryon incompatibility protein-domain-containing protein [Xylaria digitata]
MRPKHSATKLRLLDTKTYEVKEFFDENIPPYAILSHTWGDEEVTFQDIQSVEVARQQQPGFAKVEGACALASSEGHTYIWIDTCCIDKTSSAELSEAINSMYSWYQRSSVCYAYLIDVKTETQIESDDGRTESRGRVTEEPDMLSPLRHPDKLMTWNFNEAEFRNSRWFKRGWTLQELIAPSEVLFYFRDWKILGRKSLLRELISEITGVDVSILARSDPSMISVARNIRNSAREPVLTHYAGRGGAAAPQVLLYYVYPTGQRP